jgi:hypothetical protein
MPRAPSATRSHFAWLQDKLGCRSTWDRLGPKLFQIIKAFINGRLRRWPPFAKGFSSGSWTGFAPFLAYGNHYRALAEDATISEDRPVRLRGWSQRATSSIFAGIARFVGDSNRAGG